MSENLVSWVIIIVTTGVLLYSIATSICRKIAKSHNKLYIYVCSGQEGLREVVDALAENTSIKKAIAVIEDPKEDTGSAAGYTSYTLVLIRGVSGIGLYTALPQGVVTTGAPLEGYPYAVLSVWIKTTGDPLLALKEMLEKAGFTIEQIINM